ncbi:MAG: T9SS type A sorting domain-containing protein, partial [Bacteroidia bacterium]|nr:T9SS type A sorting domain-containing protein [Bacteroidia bacterium]
KFDDKDSITVTTENYVHPLKNWQPIKICLSITDINNCSSQTCKTVPVSVTPDSYQVHWDFKIYPNPNNGTFTIETQNSGELEVQIFDVLGREIGFEQNKISQYSCLIKLHETKGILFIKLKQNGVIGVGRVSIFE